MHSLNRILQKISYGIYKVFFVFATVTFAALLTMLLANVFSRNFLTGSITEVEEFSKFVFTWMMFMGISIGVYHKKHLGVEFVVEKYPKKVRRAFVLMSDILTMVLFLVLTVYGFKYSASTMRMFSPILHIPYGMVYLCIPLCGIFSLFYCVVRIVDDFCQATEKGGEET